MRPILALAAAALAAASYALVFPTAAAACGGFFCSSQPVDQSGENIVFAVGEDGSMTAHIQILYQGTAERFAWILPVPSVPEIGIGTNALFTALDAATRVRFDTEYRTEGVCRPPIYCPRASVDAAAQDAASGGWSDGGAPPPVEVLLETAVGPYDAVVLSTGDADALLAWLADNAYDIPASSMPLLMEYAALGHVFVAIRLQKDRDVGDIQPIVLRYAESDPCVPIKLTRIASTPDMPIVTYVLGARRARPVNYALTEPDLDTSGLWLGSVTYETAVSRAVDEAGGRAFVVDYAGTPPRVDIELPAVEDLRGRTITEILIALRDRGLTGEPKLLGVLLRFVPPPEGEFPNDYYNCLADSGCASGRDLSSADLDGLIDALTREIVEPRSDAQAMVTAHPYLTRLFTTMSPDEMTLDPILEIPDVALPDVSNVHTATLVTECSFDYFYERAPQRLILPSGSEVVVSAGRAFRGTASDYCASLGVPPAGGTPPPGTPPPGTVVGGGGGCGVSPGAPTWPAFALAALSALGLAMARKRPRSR